MHDKTDNTVLTGTPAPDFTLSTQDGTPLRLSDFRGKKAVVLYFYPKDNTPGCTTEACSFRDSYEIFQEAGAEVIGISSDSVTSHQRFAQRYHLPFTLLSDPQGSVRRQYRIPATFGLLPGRVTYIIDKQGIIRHTFSSQFAPEKHITEALNIIKQI
ncbi:MAG TPA: peroxiredoxin [Dictyobacter sp.]|jgi:peroxiredoxin Q/BCP|nr:peroxiredoxin [Dictyobacter sp.]